MSDIHAYTSPPKDRDPPSYLQVASSESPANAHPFASLRQLVDVNEISTDLLLCCGDICDRADPQGLRYAWQQLNDLAKKLDAKLVATVGNHDVDSRFASHRFDPKAELQNLGPPFPVDAKHASDRFWSRNYYIYEQPTYRVVTLNSCAYHGYRNAEDAEFEHEHGRVAKSTVDRLIDDLSETTWDTPPISVLICHHHPQSIDPDDHTEMMVDGHVLLRELENEGPWLVIHGHKHLANLQYGPGGGDSPVVLSCASMCATPWAAERERARNQAYLVEILPRDDRLMSSGLSMAGTVTAWDWNDQVGWSDSPWNADIPYRSGFGYRQSNRIDAIISALHEHKQVWDWPDLEQEFPHIRYMIPRDLKRLVNELNARCNVLPPPSQGAPVQIQANE